MPKNYKIEMELKDADFKEAAHVEEGLKSLMAECPGLSQTRFSESREKRIPSKPVKPAKAG